MFASISSATSKDAELLARLIRESFADVAQRFGLTMKNCPTHPSYCTFEWIDQALAKGVSFYLMEQDGTPCGCVALERTQTDLCYLERLAVIPAFRHHGLGGRLVRHALTEAQRSGAKRVELALIAHHAELRKWYERNGFTIIGTKSFSQLPFEVLFMGIDLFD